MLTLIACGEEFLMIQIIVEVTDAIIMVNMFFVMKRCVKSYEHWFRLIQNIWESAKPVSLNARL